MALNLLFILAMSVELERVFSYIGITVSKRRNRISIVTLEHFGVFEVMVKAKGIGIFGELRIVSNDGSNMAVILEHTRIVP
jgi:hypothetical protein